MSLTPKQQRFVDEYLIEPNEVQAAIRAGYSAKTAHKNAHRLMANEGVKAAIAAGRDQRSKRTQITQDAVLQRFWMIATADPNEIVEYRRTCCRYCYGKSNRYQRTKNELDRDRREHAAAVARHRADSEQPDPGTFDDQGGAGYDGRKPPSPQCQECFGDGVGGAIVKDTRNLSPAAKALYAGVKQTKDGIEAKLNDQHAALVNVARHLGMFEETVKIKNGDLPDLSKLGPDELARILAALRPVFAPAHLGGGGAGAGA